MNSQTWKDKPHTARLKTNITHVARTTKITRKCCTRTIKQVSIVACLYILLSIYFIADKDNTGFKGSHSVATENPAVESSLNLSSPVAVKVINVEAKSSNDDVYVTVDGVTVYRLKSTISSSKSRGLHVVVLNEHTGVVMASRIFDSLSDIEIDNMISFVNGLHNGRIVVFVVKDEGSYGLRKVGRNAIKQFGSRLIGNLSWRDMWALIAKKPHHWIAEDTQKSPNIHTHGQPVIIRADIELDEMVKQCNWENNEKMNRRKYFCQTYEGYGGLCNCDNPSKLNYGGELLVGNRLKSIPITVIAANRPNYLYRMLNILLSIPGVDPNMLTVYIDGFYEEVVAVVKLFLLKYVENPPVCSKNCRISQHYKRALKSTFIKYPNAEYAMILEEDLDMGIDLMDYFSQLLPVFHNDDSVFCISAWNDLGYEHSSHDPSLIYRVETMPGLGWILKRKIFVEELEPKWPDSTKYWDWDVWLRKYILKGRECIIPDISRTFHFGVRGVNMFPRFQSRLLQHKKLNKEMGVRFDRSKVIKDEYEKEINKLIKEATILDHSKNPCSNKDFIPNTKGRIYVFYIRHKDGSDEETWHRMASCFSIWDLNVRGTHKSMWRFWIKENMIFVVGTSSPYIIHKPYNVAPIFMAKKRKAPPTIIIPTRKND